MRSKARVVLLACWIVVLAIGALAEELRGRVISISDGDTITILDAARQQHKVRLNGIDAPEKDQDFGQVSKKHLSDLVFGKDVAVLWSKKDKYGRIIGTVMLGSTNVNLEQLKAGLAWYYRQYAGDVPAVNRESYERAELEARRAGRGLWRQSNPTPPWEFRHPGQPSTPTSTGVPRPTSGKIIGNQNSHVYHRPDCPDYGKVSERNRVYFNSAEDAERAGFRQARNCP